MNRWEFLKHRAQLAGITVEENQSATVLRAASTGSLFIREYTDENIEAVAKWLMERGVNLPGWDLPWPANQ